MFTPPKTKALNFKITFIQVLHTVCEILALWMVQSHYRCTNITVPWASCPYNLWQCMLSVVILNAFLSSTQIDYGPVNQITQLLNSHI